MASDSGIILVVENIASEFLRVEYVIKRSVGGAVGAYQHVSWKTGRAVQLRRASAFKTIAIALSANGRVLIAGVKIEAVRAKKAARCLGEKLVASKTVWGEVGSQGALRALWRAVESNQRDVVDSIKGIRVSSPSNCERECCFSAVVYHEVRIMLGSADQDWPYFLQAERRNSRILKIVYGDVGYSINCRSKADYIRPVSDLG